MKHGILSKFVFFKIMDKFEHLNVVAWAAITEVPSTGLLKQRKVTSHSSGGLRSPKSR